MTDVFISYRRTDRPMAAWLADALESEGYDVWWDEDLLPGREFRDDIAAILAAARAVCVIWSNQSVKSAWVRSEANAAFQNGRLLPVSIGAAEIPPPFDECQTLDLTRWRGDPADDGFQKLLKGLKHILGDTLVDQGPGPLPSPDAQRFTVMIAGIENDIGNQLQEVVAADLSRHEGLHVVTLSRRITQTGQRPQNARSDAHAEAVAWLEESGGTVMIWGRVLRFAGREVPELNLTIAQGRNRPPGRYIPNMSLRLPRVFWSDLANILIMVCLAYDTEFRALEGSYLGDRLRPFVDRVSRLLAAATPHTGWRKADIASVRILVGEALMLLGIQQGNRADLDDAIRHFRDAAPDISRDESASDWARAMNGIGIACRVQAERTGDAALLDEALAACQSSIDTRNRDDEPVAYAQGLNDLGNAYLAKAARNRLLPMWEAAIKAYNSALVGRNVRETPLDWAQTEGNIGFAYWILAELTGNGDRLAQAEDHLERSLSIYTRASTPLDWAQTQNNLGLVAWSNGKFSGVRSDFTRAARHFRRALRGRPSSAVPLLWSETMNNLGLVFASDGEARPNLRRFGQAIAIYERAEGGASRRDAPAAWANVRNNAGAALWNLGLETNSAEQLRRAVGAFEDAWLFYGDTMPGSVEHCRALRNLGNAEFALGKVEGDHTRILSALKHLAMAVDALDGGQQIATKETVELLFDWGISLGEAKKLGVPWPSEPTERAVLKRAFDLADALGMDAHSAALSRLLQKDGSDGLGQEMP